VRLTPILSAAGFHADSSDVALVKVEVVDAQGRRCPTALDLVEFQLDGRGEWRDGIAQGPDKFILSRTLPVKGVNRVLIRSTSMPGIVTLTADTDQKGPGPEGVRLLDG